MGVVLKERERERESGKKRCYKTCRIKHDASNTRAEATPKVTLGTHFVEKESIDLLESLFPGQQ